MHRAGILEKGIRLAIRSNPFEVPHAELPLQAVESRYVARQPILDQRGRVHGYELLFRNGPDAAFNGDGDQATRTMIDNTVMFGLERLTGGLPAFVNCTEDTLIDDLVNVMPADLTVLEILESVDPSPRVIEACRTLKESGFRLALDDFVWMPKFAPLAELADYIKVDFTLTDSAGRQDLLQRLKGMNVTLLAEKVETQEEYQRARAEGFTLFQGYYFCRPMLVKNCTVPANRIIYFDIMQLLHKDPMDMRRLGELIKRDASLTYRLLRLVNSPVYAVRQEVRSVQAALVMVGESTFRRIALLAIASELNAGQPTEILRMALVRARFCELAAGLCKLDATEQYLLGMLSLLPAMLLVPMEVLTPALPLRETIRNVLEGANSSEGSLLSWVEAHEQGDWNACDAILRPKGLQSEQVNKCYTEAVFWAESAFRLTT
jgi:EAL and modified HD-GYP domain-containing signal transduction protein